MASQSKVKFRSVRHDTNEDLDHSEQMSSNEHDTNSNNANSTSTTQDFLKIKHSHKRTSSQSVMVRLKRLDLLRLNQRIQVMDYGFGTIKFLGCVHFSQGLFVGVELDEPKGKHDGSYHGKRYFTAQDKHGVLVKQHRVELLDVETTNPANAKVVETPQSDDFLNNLDLSEFEEFFKDDKTASNRSSFAMDVTPSSDQIKINELQMSNKALNDKIEEYMTGVDELELKISSLENENAELKEDKAQFENEMNSKIEELESQMRQIREQLNTKDEVLKKQITSHDNTKTKFSRKIKEHEALKQKNQDTVQSILYGDNTKDDIILQHRQKEQRYEQEKAKCSLEMEHITYEAEQKINKHIQEWLFDYGS